jgi:hypothetical protein
MEGEVVKLINNPRIEPTQGTAGLKTQVYGACATVSNVANSTGGIAKGAFIETDSK